MRMRKNVAAVMRFQATKNNCGHPGCSSKTSGTPLATTPRTRRRNAALRQEPDVAIQGIEFRDSHHMITVSDRDR
jgi:hypothetical protein